MMPGEGSACQAAEFGWSRLVALCCCQRDGRPQAAEMTVSRDIEYVPGGHERQKLDLYLPKKAGLADSVAPRRPLIVWIHGGAWRAGSKDRCPARRFVREGYAVASVNYRLSQHAIFPAQIHLRAHAEEYGLDGARFGVWGSSAGGHLVALLGTAGGVEEFDVGPNTGVSSRVQAVCDFFGPTDFAKMSRFWSTMDHDAPDSPESKLIGGPVQEHKDNVQRAIHEALKNAGVGATFYTVQGGGHGGFKDPNVQPLVAKFFRQHLDN